MIFYFTIDFHPFIDILSFYPDVFLFNIIPSSFTYEVSHANRKGSSLEMVWASNCSSAILFVGQQVTELGI